MDRRVGEDGLVGSIAIVTGGGRGIGAEVCRRLGHAGARVAVVDIDSESAHAVAAGLPGAVAYPADVTESAAVDEVVADVVRRCGRVDVAVPCAGVMHPAAVTSLSDHMWRKVLDSHLTGALAVVRAAAPSMIKQRYGRVVLVSSVAARGLAGNAAYSTAKAGIVGLTRSLALELGPYGVVTNAVAPGFIDTAMTRAGAQRPGRDWTSFAGAAARKSAVRRIGTTADVAAVVAFLAHPEAAYVNGQVIQVTGSP